MYDMKQIWLGIVVVNGKKVLQPRPMSWQNINVRALPDSVVQIDKFEVTEIGHLLVVADGYQAASERVRKWAFDTYLNKGYLTEHLIYMLPICENAEPTAQEDWFLTILKVGENGLVK